MSTVLTYKPDSLYVRLVQTDGTSPTGNTISGSTTSPTALGDDSDGTYVLRHGASNDAHHWYYYDDVYASFNAKSINLYIYEMRVRIRLSGSANMGTNPTVRPPDWSTETWLAQMPAGSSAGWVMSDPFYLGSQLKTQGLDVTLGIYKAGATGMEYPDTVTYYEVELLVSDGPITPPAPSVLVAPPCRIFPRADALGAASGRRHFPQPCGNQRSLRRGGGTYY